MGDELEVEYKIGDITTVWDREILGIPGGLSRVREEKKVLILADSKAAIAAIQKAGRRGLASLRHIQEVVNIIAEIKSKGGEVKLGWVKAYIRISGNEATDTIAKKAAESVKPLDVYERWMSGGGIRQRNG